jgi:hypothetical protein
MSAILKPQQFRATLAAGMPVPGPPGPPGPAGSQTPWSQDVDGGGWNLTNVADIDITGEFKVNGVPISSGGGGSQTPWLSDIDAANHILKNVASINGPTGSLIDLGSNNIQLSAGSGGLVALDVVGNVRFNGDGGPPATSGSPAQDGVVRISVYHGPGIGSGNVLDMGCYVTSPYGAWLQVSDLFNAAIHYPLMLQPNGGEVTIGANLVFANLPTSAAGLPAGAVWNNNGVLNIA